jgi:hypothetical protein
LAFGNLLIAKCQKRKAKSKHKCRKKKIWNVPFVDEKKQKLTC